MDVKDEVLLKLFNKSKLKNETKTFIEPKLFSIVKFKKLGFSAPLRTTSPVVTLSSIPWGISLISRQAMFLGAFMISGLLE